MEVKRKRRKGSVVSSSLPGPWLSWTRTLSCKSRDVVLVAPSSHKQHPHHQQQQQPQQQQPQQQQQQQAKYKSRSSFYSSSSSSSSACNCSNLKDVIHGNTRVVHRASSAGSPRSNKDVDDLSPSTDAGIFSPDESHEAPLVSLSSSAQHQQHRKKFGCNGCNVAVDTMVEYSSMVAVKSCNFPQLACLKCGDYFSRIDALEQHHALHHAVSEVPRGDSSRNIIEIIFRSSWTMPQAVCGKIERVLKVHNSQRTLARFEEYRDAVKSKANVAASATSNSTMSRKNTTNSSSNSNSSSRCIADGNELLRFYGTSLTCALGGNGSSSLCSSPSCGVCRIARWGFSSSAKSSKGTAIRTTATSSTAHWQAAAAGSASGDRQAVTRRTAMVVCRVIAGRSYKAGGGGGSSEGATMLLPAGFDSVELGSDEGHEDLLVFNSKAVLPCFVVIYKC